MGWLILGIVLSVTAVVLMSAKGWWSHRRKLARIERDLVAMPALGGPNARKLDDLPASARKLLEHMIAPDAPPIRAVRFRLDGEIKPGKESGWLPIRSTELLRVPGGFTWRAATGWPLKLAGGDHYFDNDGGVNFWLFGLLHIVKGRGKDVMRSARGRAACEAMWFPPALLAAKWLPGDAPVCKLQLDGEDYTLEFRIDEVGRIESVRGERWGDDTDDRSWAKLKFGADFTGEVSAEGYTIPSEFTAGWHHGTDEWEQGKFFRAKLTDVSWIE
ncbi:MAG: hypothetical protein KDB90_09220 [Planctomycetes bacterium]|nr:hypothetical protein [Planctomycetota bacterium]